MANLREACARGGPNLGLLEKVVPPDRFAGALATVKAGVTPEVWTSLGR